MVKTPLPNNGNTLVDYLHENELIKDGMKVEEIEKIAEPLMMNPKNLKNDDFWEDVYYRAEELGYQLFQ
jgi:hypothetical protein